VTIESEAKAVAGPPPLLPPSPSAGPARHTARWAGLGALIICAGLVAVLATRPSATVTEAQSPLVSRSAPLVSGKTITGATFSLPARPGRYIVLNFFASWCEPCQAEGPALVAFQFQHQRTGDASLISVVFDDTVGAATSYQEQLGARWPTLVDPDHQLALSFGVRAPPSTFVIAPDGRVVAYIIGPVTAADLDQIIARAEASHP